MSNYARMRDFDTLAMDNPVTPPIGASRDQNTHLINRIPVGMFDKCREVTVGVGVVIEDGVRFMCDKVTIGDFVYIGRGTTIRTPEFSVGDYTRINEASYGGGRKPLRIGRNVYLGRGVYLDSNGGLTLEDNTLAGAYSQLWTHIEGGDMIYGCDPRWEQERTLVVRNEAWLVGRVVVSHATEIGERALILNESNVLENVPHDTTWAGNPAKDVTAKLGRQVMDRNHFEIKQVMLAAIFDFEVLNPQYEGYLLVDWMDTRKEVRAESHQTVFYIQDRTYTKKRTPAEVAFLKWSSAKFVPVGEN